MELIEIIRCLIEEGEKLLPLGGDIVDGYNGENQPDYVAWRLQTIITMKKLGSDADPFVKDLEEDKQGPYFYTSSARRVLGVLKGALAVARAQADDKGSNRQETEETVSRELFPLNIVIVKGINDYVEGIAKQVNGCYGKGWYDSCAVMARRLLEVLIIDSFEVKGKLCDIQEMGNSLLSFEISEQPTASEVRRFLEEDFSELETALNDVRVSLGGNRLTDFSATSNWESLKSRFANIPNDVSLTLNKVIEMRDLARGGTTKLTRKQLLSAKRGIIKMLDFLDRRFPSAGINLPYQGEIISLARLIEKYLAVADDYWHVERTARSALGKIKAIGDIGAHGRYVKVTKQTLDKNQDALISGIQQLVGTARRA